MTTILKAEQSDRDAAESVYYAIVSGDIVMRGNLKLGRADNHPLVQAFARNRIAERKRCIEIAETCVLTGHLIPGYPDGMSAAACQIVDALKDGK